MMSGKINTKGTTFIVSLIFIFGEIGVYEKVSNRIFRNLKEGNKRN